MSIWQQIKKTSTDFTLMLLFGSLGALIPAVFGWWALPAMGVAAIILLFGAQVIAEFECSVRERCLTGRQGEETGQGGTPAP